MTHLPPYQERSVNYEPGDLKRVTWFLWSSVSSSKQKFKQINKQTKNPTIPVYLTTFFQRLTQDVFWKEFYNTIKCNLSLFHLGLLPLSIQSRTLNLLTIFLLPRCTFILFQEHTFYIKMHTCISTKMYNFQRGPIGVSYMKHQNFPPIFVFFFLDRLLSIHLWKLNN